ncbi:MULTISPECIES: TetR/AcrR family transcriptional regulator [Actinomyces]|uniref:TetR/AcrR family transcriptional regulator n=1 Tax=Actinomyces respiraculi TaxID=2744574 RepID=A0A7T0LKD9_9ACTO|nr:MULTISPECIES: TetR/AcrR family transcriptional regulator [Actinomyces]QPL05414.1 TetR/AcrR family transcriptional regulator [Actinomyces respiraculi]
MPQVLKAEVRERLVAAAEHVFYVKGFMDARLSDIAAQAGVSTSLVYSYFKNKEDLFAETVQILPLDFDEIGRQEEELDVGSPYERYAAIADDYMKLLLKHHRAFVIVMDKSQGTAYANSKSEMVTAMQHHIARQLEKKSPKKYPDLLPHVLASNFVEGLLEAARHYQSPEQAHELLDWIMRCYYEGVNSL